jgi:hypothetical protein
MKIYIKAANKFTNKVSQMVSKVYTPEKIAEKSQGSYKGESMAQIFDNIMHDPNISFGDPNKDGDQVILYNGENIGWINFKRHIGDISPKGYAKLQKYVAPESEDVEDEGQFVEDIEDEDADY